MGERSSGDDGICNSSEPKMAASPRDQRRRTFDFSESEYEDDSEENVLETTEKMLPEKQALSDPEEMHEKADRPSSAKELSEDTVEDVYSIDYVIEDHGGTDNGQNINSTIKHQKFRMVCNECGTSFPRREMFYLHRHYHAHKDELVPLNCLECGLSFKDRRSLMKHRHVHKEEPKYEEEARFQCAACEKFFPTAPKLRRHHCNDSDDKPYHCTLCRKEFVVRCAVAKHMLNHSEEGNWTCKKCGGSFPDYKTMRYHQPCHSELKPLECSECGMTFTHSSAMEAHQRKHAEHLRSFLCPLCGKTFTDRILFQEGQNLRTSEEPFRCPDCAHQADPPVSAPVQVLQRQEKAHQRDEPKHTCNSRFCPQTISSPANLRAHMQFHEMEFKSLEKNIRSHPEIEKVWEEGSPRKIVWTKMTTIQSMREIFDILTVKMKTN